MVRKSLWKEAYELAEEYKKRGIGYCYNQRNKNVYLTVLNAPYCAEGKEEDVCQLTGHLIIYGGVVASREIDKWVDEVKRNYINSYKNNPTMLKYAEVIG